jgi:hypothetical protein
MKSYLFCYNFTWNEGNVDIYRIECYCSTFRTLKFVLRTIRYYITLWTSTFVLIIVWFCTSRYFTCGFQKIVLNFSTEILDNVLDNLLWSRRAPTTQIYRDFLAYSNVGQHRHEINMRRGVWGSIFRSVYGILLTKNWLSFFIFYLFFLLFFIFLIICRHKLQNPQFLSNIRFVDACAIVDHHCLNFLFLIQNEKYYVT